MNVKAIPAPAAPSNQDTSLEAPNSGQVAMVVMLVPIPAPADPPAPSYVDSQDHVWLLVDKASPMAAVLQQITAAEPSALAPSSQQTSRDRSARPDLSLGAPTDPGSAALGAEPLSRREIDVLRLMADGRSNKEIAQSLVLALSTIKMHVKHIYGKLGVKNRVQAVAQARSLGIIAMEMR